ncbi:TPA: hypothetical protein DEB00_00575 [Candidatus Uhrbacteria bacterium]|nr:hypothetical protein [Candidatus Uhrbacteria bacterium]
MKQIYVYVAGKVSKESVFGTHDWRDAFCLALSRHVHVPVINVDPTKESETFLLPETDAQFIFGRDCTLIQMADVVIVNLTDDISVGGSQEMLIAKYYQKPLVGIAPLGGKFYKSQKEIGGRVHTDWKHPFVAVPCDAIVEDEREAGEWIAKWAKGEKQSIKTLSILDESIAYYTSRAEQDAYVQLLKDSYDE